MTYLERLREKKLFHTLGGKVSKVSKAPNHHRKPRKNFHTPTPARYQKYQKPLLYLLILP